MVVYKLVGRTNPTDWAEMPRFVDLGLFETRKGALEEMTRMEHTPDVWMDWKYFRIDEITLGA